MRSRHIAFAASVLLAMPLFAQAEGEALSRMEALESRMMALEDQLQSSQATVAAQRELLNHQATPAVGEGSSMDGFLSGLEIGGHVTASYLYNFNNPDFPTGTQPLGQFNVNHNTFELDAVKLEIGRPTDGPGTAGFQFDMLMGANNHILCADGLGSPSDSGVCLQEAYLAYDYSGTELKFGKFETLLGYEVIDSPYNNHITHGTLFTFAIPLVHTGLLASGNVTEEIDWAAGIVNGFNLTTDTGDNKGVLGRLGWSRDNTSVGFNVYIGKDQLRVDTKATTAGFIGPGGVAGLVGDDRRERQIYDLTVEHSPNDDLTLWLNADLGREEGVDLTSATCLGGGPGSPCDSDGKWYGVAGGFNWSLSERTTLAMRGEWFHDNGASRLFGTGLLGAALPPLRGSDTDLYSGTVTLGCALTNNLTTRLEFRHDRFDTDGSSTAGIGFPDSGGTDDKQNLGVFEVSYTFD